MPFSESSLTQGAVTFSPFPELKLTPLTQSPLSSLGSFVRGQLDGKREVPAVEIAESLISGESEIRG